MIDSAPLRTWQPLDDQRRRPRQHEHGADAARTAASNAHPAPVTTGAAQRAYQFRTRSNVLQCFCKRWTLAGPGGRGRLRRSPPNGRAR